MALDPVELYVVNDEDAFFGFCPIIEGEIDDKSLPIFEAA